MDLSSLPKITKRAAKRVGRGYGSGKGGHTSGRGSKGQKARGKLPLTFEGTKVKKSLIKRLPLLRGKGRLKPWGKLRTPINLALLADWPAKTPVTTENLVKAGVIKEGQSVKILGEGDVKKALTVQAPISKNAAEKVTAAGGKIIENG